MTLTLLRLGNRERPHRRAACDRDRAHGRGVRTRDRGESRPASALVGALVATGAFGASVNSASGRAVMNCFAPTERGLALGIRQAAIPLGGFAGALALPALVSARGVHAAFVALAVNALVWAVLAGFVLRERHVDEDIAVEFVSPLARPSDVAPLFGERLASSRASSRSCRFVVLFLHDARGFSTAHAALVLAAVQVGGRGDRIAVGRRSDRERRRVPLFIRLAAVLAVVLADSGRARRRPDRRPRPRARRRRHLRHELERPLVHRSCGGRGASPQRRGDRLSADGSRRRRNRHPDRSSRQSSSARLGVSRSSSRQRRLHRRGCARPLSTGNRAKTLNVGVSDRHSSNSGLRTRARRDDFRRPGSTVVVHIGSG